MNDKRALSIVEPFLTKERFDHTLRVAEEAKRLARIYEVDVSDIEIASIFHDYAKYRPLDEMKRIIEKSYLPKDLLTYHHELWHGPVAMIVFLADYIEPCRDFPGVDNVREAVQQSLEQATWKSLQQTIQFLSGKGREIYPDTFHAYNYYTKRINGGH